MARLAALALVSVLAAPLLPAQGKSGSHPIITEFKKYIKDKSSSVRKDQVARLTRVDTEESVALLLKYGLLDDTYHVRDRAIWALSRFKTPEARQAVVAALQHSNQFVKEGAALALAKCKDWKEPPVAELIALLKKSRKERVKNAAAFALGMLGRKEATPALCASLGSRKESILIAVADALALIRDETAAEALEPLLDNVSWRVQVAAVHALGQIRAKRSVQPCIAYLRDADGRPQKDAHLALQRITQRTFGMNPDTWQEWWDRVKARWTVPPIEKAKKKTMASVATGYAKAKRKPTRYHRITTHSKRLTFVLDISTSMLDPILVKRGRDTGKADPNFGSARKIDIAREELAHTLRKLDAKTKINIIAFETDIRVWKKQAIPASPGNVQAAIKWVERQEPRRPGGSGFRASSGIDSKGRIVGRTNTYGALRKIFGFKGDKRGGVTHGGRGPRPKWDTCFFLTDGVPTEGSTIEIPEILADVKRWNKTAKVRIHTIGMNRDGGLMTLINGLAELTGGQAVYLGR